MKIYTILFIISTLFTSLTMAQVDQISVGEAYSYQAYYNISTGEVTQISNTTWDIAFTSQGSIDAGIFINESATSGSESLKLFLSEETEWDNPITSTTEFDDASILYNDELSWTEGAFNHIKNEDNPFDFGWGQYNPNNHVIEGDKIYVIQLRDLTFIKFQMQELKSGAYTFRYAQLDGTGEVTKTISKNTDENVALLYYSFDTESTVDVPTDYDFVFQRYVTPLDDGTGNFIPYTVTGILSAPGVQAAVATEVDPTTVDESDYTHEYNEIPNTIGHEWKFFDFTSGWLVDENRAHFIRTRDGEIYKVVFYDFEGSATGTATFEKFLLGTVSAQESRQNVGLTIFPNPTNEYITIDSEVDFISGSIIDGSGKAVRLLNKSELTQEINLSSLKAGVYHIILNGNDFFTTQSVIIAH